MSSNAFRGIKSCLATAAFLFWLMAGACYVQPMDVRVQPRAVEAAPAPDVQVASAADAQDVPPAEVQESSGDLEEAEAPPAVVAEPIIYLNPRHHGRIHEYVYYPGVNVYFDPIAVSYWWFAGGVWVGGAVLPAGIVINDYDAVRFRCDFDRPYRYHSRIIHNAGFSRAVERNRYNAAHHINLHGGSSGVGHGRTTIGHGKTMIGHGKTTVGHGKTTIGHGKTTVGHGKTTIGHGKTTVGHGKTTKEHAKTTKEHAKTTKEHANTKGEHTKTEKEHKKE